MQRNATLDHARLWAACGIVLFHTGAPGAAIGYAALPFFLMLMIVLAGPATRRQDFPTFVRSRATRLLAPWLVWSAVYGMLKLLDVMVSDKPLATEFVPYMILTGPALHLWFLPFAFVVCLALYPLVRHRLTSRHFALFLGVIAVLTFIFIGLQQQQGLPIPLAQWVFSLPAVVLGLGFTLAKGRPAWVLAMLFTIAMTTGLALWVTWTEGVVQIVIASLALVSCTLIETRESAVSRWAAQISLAVYLVHPLVIAVLLRLTALPEKSPAFALLAIVGSVATATMLSLRTLMPRSAVQTEV
jgi:peptidoglycan/LPS O-acetylase OafA/YrhL